MGHHSALILTVESVGVEPTAVVHDFQGCANASKAMKTWRENTTLDFQLYSVLKVIHGKTPTAHSVLVQFVLCLLPFDKQSPDFTMGGTLNSQSKYLGIISLHSYWQHPGYIAACIPEWDKGKGNQSLANPRLHSGPAPRSDSYK